MGSIASIASAGSIMSVGSTGSILSIGSAGSILSIGSVGSLLCVGSSGSILSRDAQGEILRDGHEPLRGGRLLRHIGVVTSVGLAAAITTAVVARCLAPDRN